MGEKRGERRGEKRDKWDNKKVGSERQSTTQTTKIEIDFPKRKETRLFGRRLPWKPAIYFGHFFFFFLFSFFFFLLREK